MRFKILGGGHFHEGRNYKHGEEIEVDYDLAAIFGAKFEKIHEPQVAVASPLKKIRKAADARGVDVSENWEKALEHSLKVFQRGKKYHVYLGDSTSPLNDKGLKEEKVESFIEEHLEA